MDWQTIKFTLEQKYKESRRLRERIDALESELSEVEREIADLEAARDARTEKVG